MKVDECRQLQPLRPLVATPVAAVPARHFSRSAVAPAAAAAVKLTSDNYPELERDSRFSKLTAEHVTFFKDVVGANAVIEAVTTDAAKDDIEAFNADWMGKYRGQSQLVVKPATTGEVSQILKISNPQSGPVAFKVRACDWKSSSDD